MSNASSSAPISDKAIATSAFEGAIACALRTAATTCPRASEKEEEEEDDDTDTFWVVTFERLLFEKMEEEVVGAGCGAGSA
mmetsp:Transcript_54865/g.88927  ORF Transcript_54865/g.88927 Transcript_54865/m.88927 type:complete len:81 (-) Transcript_54865:133-375(-)